MKELNLTICKYLSRCCLPDLLNLLTQQLIVRVEAFVTRMPLFLINVFCLFVYVISKCCRIDSGNESHLVNIFEIGTA